MSTGEYLNEERYQKNKKGLMIASAVIAILGVLIGGGLIVGGIALNNSASQIDTSMPKYSTKTWWLDDEADQGDDWMNNVRKKGDQEFSAFGMIGGGGFILFASLMVALSLLLIAKRREIMAFQVQQVAPVAKEGVEKATPVVSKAAGSIAKEIAKGIKEGKADEPTSKSKPEEPKE